MSDRHPDVLTEPSLSVTITNYNYARFLPRAIESVLGQTYTDFELIIIDNASTDDSLAVIGRYSERDRRIRVVTHEVNQGGLASFRESCEVARGRYRVHVDADDWVISPDAFRLQVDMMEAHPDMAFVFGRLTMFGTEGERSWVSRPHEHDCILTDEQALEDILGFNFGHSGLMLRLDAYHATGGYPDDMPHIDDLVLAIRLANRGTVGYIDDELYAFNQHGANVHMSPQASVVRDEILPLIDEAFASDLARRLPDPEAVRRRVERRALVHLPTAYIFTDRRREGWKLYLLSVRERPLRTVLQLRTLSLVARTVLGQHLFDAARNSVKRIVTRPRSIRS